METADWKQTMAASFGKAVKKLTRAKIRAISLAGKALLEGDIFERFSREAQGTFSFYFESAWQVKWTCLNQVLCFVDLSSTAVRHFLIYCTKKGKVISMLYFR